MPQEPGPPDLYYSALLPVLDSAVPCCLPDWQEDIDSEGRLRCAGMAHSHRWYFGSSPAIVVGWWAQHPELTLFGVSPLSPSNVLLRAVLDRGGDLGTFPGSHPYASITTSIHPSTTITNRL